MGSMTAAAGRIWTNLGPRSVALAALLTLPAVLVVYFAFNSGGFFPAAPAFVAAVLCIVLLARCLFGSPFEGIGAFGGLAVALLAAFTLLSLVSQAWSHSPELAFEAFDRSLVYLLVLLLFVSVGRRRLRIGWILRTLAMTIVGICACALITRTLPRVWPIGLHFAASRLSFPISYWNALGLFAAFGIVLCVHLSSDRDEHPLVRVFGATAVPLLGTTLYFTLSRGGIGALVIGLVVYLLAGRPRYWVSTAVATVPTTAIAAIVAYHADRLTGNHPTSAAAVHQGHHVAVVVLVCIVAATLLRAVCVPTLDRLAAPSRLAARTRSALGWALPIAGLVIAVVLVIGFHGRIAHEYDQFKRAGNGGIKSNERSRLTSVTNDNRLPLWRVAWHEFKDRPLLGQGADTFKNSWDQHGQISAGTVVNAHNLYLETLDTLGIVGAVLLFGAMLIILLASLVRARGPGRVAAGAVLAVLVMFTVHAAVDWDWQMPVLTVIFFALGGLTLGRPLETAGASQAAVASETDAATERGLSTYARAALGIGCCVLAVAPVYFWLSQRELDRATTAFAAGDCATVRQAALKSISILGTRPEAYEALGYCDVDDGEPRLGIPAMRKAISLDPNNWRLHYGLAVVTAAAGFDPRAAALRARHFYPHDGPLRADTSELLRASSSEWPRVGLRLARRISVL